jgi:hypothetical protein
MYFNALSQHGLTETEETVKQRSQSRFPAYVLKIEPRNFWIQNRSTDHWTIMFNEKDLESVCYINVPLHLDYFKCSSHKPFNMALVKLERQSDTIK